MSHKTFILRGKSSTGIIISGTGAYGTGNHKLLVCNSSLLQFENLKLGRPKAQIT